MCAVMQKTCKYHQFSYKWKCYILFKNGIFLLLERSRFVLIYLWWKVFVLKTFLTYLKNWIRKEEMLFINYDSCVPIQMSNDLYKRSSFVDRCFEPWLDSSFTEQWEKLYESNILIYKVMFPPLWWTNKEFGSKMREKKSEIMFFSCAFKLISI